MYILSNAFGNVLRNKGRNLLLGAIILVIIVSTVVTLMINNTSSSIIDSYKSRFGSEVIFSVNMDRARETATAHESGGTRINISQITSEQYLWFGESEYIASANYIATIGINGNDLTAVDAELGGGTDRQTMGNPNSSPPETPLYYSSLKAGWGEDFRNGYRDMATGRIPETSGECIVSTDFAELNGLSENDIITVYTYMGNTELTRDDPDYYETVEYSLTIVGTYYDATEEYNDTLRHNAYENRRNEILTTYETIISQTEGLSGIQLYATYYLHSPEYLEEFAAECYEKGLDSVYDVKTDEAGYNRIIKPVEGLRGVSMTFMIIVLVFGGVIIALLSTMAIRERKYEIGVLRAMGMKKRKVALGLWSEMLMITCFCLVIGMMAGLFVAQPITDTLLAEQVEAAAESETAGGNIGGGGMMGGGNAGGGGMRTPLVSSEIQPLDEINITLGIDTAAQITGIALLLATFAALIAISRITKYEPIKILMERN